MLPTGARIGATIGRVTSTPLDRVAVYAFGGGHGHGVRALGLVAGLRSAHPSVEVILLAPDRFSDWARTRGVELVSPPQAATRSGPALAEWLDGRLKQFEPGGLVVDVFPRGVLGEFSLTPGLPPRALIGRYIDPRYYQAVAEELSRYHRIIWVEPPPEALSLEGEHVRVEPLVLTERILERAVARRELGLPREGPAVLVLGTGTARDQLRLLEALRFVEHLCFFSTRLSPDGRVLGRFPAAQWLRAADVVIAGGGYQSYYEVVQAGVPAVFLPGRRQLDDQARRVLGHLGYPPRAAFRVVSRPELLEQAVTELLKEPTAEPIVFRGGEQAAHHVLEALG